MRLLLPLLLIGFLSSSGFSQKLDFNAKTIKEKYSEKYTNTIRKHAMSEWGTDYRMVVYEINKQSDSLVELVNSFKSEHTNIAYQAILDWSVEGYKTHNKEQFEAIKTFGLEQLLDFHCDWRMVKYTYDKQVKAKSAF